MLKREKLEILDAHSETVTVLDERLKPKSEKYYSG
jgi:hypothetical protein